jgi:hypothetical protein
MVFPLHTKASTLIAASNTFDFILAHFRGKIQGKFIGFVVRTSYLD